MRTLTFLFLVGLLAGTTQGQDLFPQRPAAGKTPPQSEAAYSSDDVLGRMASGKLFKWPLPNPFQKMEWFRPNTILNMLEAGPKVCAVRLLEAPLPGDTNFRMPQLRPAESVEPMPEVKVPAPACPNKPR
jgi:hypothetical protein